MKRQDAVASLHTLTIPRRRHAFTVDVEDWFDGIPISNERRSLLQPRIEQGLLPLLEMLAEYDVKGTFFILGALAEHRPDLVRRIAAAGHEIGCHGWSHDPIFSMTRERFSAETRRSKDTLEQIVGGPVIGYRAAYFSIVRKTLWAVDVLADLGFEYDSSIFPVRNWRYGMANFPSEPTRIDSRGGSIHEFPINVESYCGVAAPFSGGAYFRIYPYSLTARHFRNAAARGEAGVFYLHPWELDCSQPKIGFDVRAWLTHYANLATTHRKLRRLLSEFEFEPLGQWQAKTLTASFDGAGEEVVVEDGRGGVGAAADGGAAGGGLFGVDEG